MFKLLLFTLAVMVTSRVAQVDAKVKDPVEDMTTPEIIRYAGFKAEVHHVQTSDGYVLGVHRISNPGKTPVFLQHGLLSSSADYVLNGVNESLGFLLAKSKYDVWLGNFRGNTYSRKHVRYSPDEKKFWMFSWDEMATYDLPAMIDYVLKNTSHDSLYYVGHSMGTTTAFALLSSKPEYNKKINTFFALAPVTSVGHMESPIRYLSTILPEIELLVEIFHIYEFLPHSKIIQIVGDIFCKELPFKKLCADPIFLLCGFDEEQLNMTRLPVYFAHTPAGTSTQTVIHYAQLVNSKNFARYDYGSEENTKRYHQRTPPEYQLKNVTAPTVLFWGQNDWLADPRDVKALSSDISGALLKNVRVNFTNWDHLDFLWAIQAKKYVYNQLLEMIAIDIRKER